MTIIVYSMVTKFATPMAPVPGYEKERMGLGEEFLAEVAVTAQLVLERPAAYPVVVRQARRALVHRFPYGLFYRILDDTVVFVACFHTSRNPAIWVRRH